MHRFGSWILRSKRIFEKQRQLVYQIYSTVASSAVEKKAKNRNETDSNLSLGTRLTRVKRLSRERSYDTTPDRCQEDSRPIILFRIS